MAWVRGQLALSVFAFLAVQTANAASPDTSEKLIGDEGSVALDIIRMEACRAAWNYHISEAVNGGNALSAAQMSEPTGKPDKLGDIAGLRFSYTSSALAGVDVCGWYFIPGGANPPNNSDSARSAAQAQTAAIASTLGTFNTVAARILTIIPQKPEPASEASQPTASSIAFDASVEEAVEKYRQALAAELGKTAPAGSNISALASDSLPVSEPPKRAMTTAEIDEEKAHQSLMGWALASDAEAWAIRKAVSHDMAAYDVYESRRSRLPK